MNLSDQQLIEAYIAGDKKSFEILIERYFKPVYGFIYRFIGAKSAQDAEDITQDVFAKIWRHIKKFDKKKNFKTWIFSIAKNAAIDFIRKKKILPFSEFENEDGENIIADKLIDSAPLPGELLERKEIGEMLAKAMGKLSPKYRMVLFLRYNDHFTFREISESLNESLDTIKSRHLRALIMLKKIIAES